MDQTFDNYLIVKSIGSGGFGNIYEGFNKIKKEKCTLKIVQHQTNKYLNICPSEIQILLKIKQKKIKNILEITDYILNTKSYTIITKYIPYSIDLYEFLYNKKIVLTKNEKIKIFQQLVEILYNLQLYQGWQVSHQ